MEATGSLVVVEIILDKLRFISLQAVGQSSCRCNGFGSCILGMLCVQLLAEFIAGVCIHDIEKVVGIYPAYVVSDCCLEAGVHSSAFNPIPPKPQIPRIPIHSLSTWSRVHSGVVQSEITLEDLFA